MNPCVLRSQQINPSIPDEIPTQTPACKSFTIAFVQLNNNSIVDKESRKV